LFLTVASALFQPGGGVHVGVVEVFDSLMHVLFQETVTRQTVSSNGAVEQPQLVMEDFHLHTQKEGLIRFILSNL